MLPEEPGARDHKVVQNMNTYEFAVVVSAKLEDDARAAVIEKVNEMITRFGGELSADTIFLVPGGAGSQRP